LGRSVYRDRVPALMARGWIDFLRYRRKLERGVLQRDSHFSFATSKQ
jgi:hypothetical protein